MRILLLGGSGQIGWELHRSLAPLGDVLAPPRSDLDLLDGTALRGAVRAIRPEVIINAAAYTDVERAESDPDTARRLNREAPGALAAEAARLGAALIHFSTDYVFDGTKEQPYQEKDPPLPLNVYGRTKLEGEQAIRQVGGAHLILRTSWIYSLRRPCFVTRVLADSRTKAEMRFTVDQVGSPTWCRPVAEATAELLFGAANGGLEGLRRRTGLYHLACHGLVDRYGWAEAILRLDPRKTEQVVVKVREASSAEFPSPAARPSFSALDSSRFEEVFGIRLPEWQVALRQAFLADDDPSSLQRGTPDGGGAAGAAC
jgi:dTDP-4-dehydrorhamnose reductase